jgi:hypothetical protein
LEIIIKNDILGRGAIVVLQMSKSTPHYAIVSTNRIHRSWKSLLGLQTPISRNIWDHLSIKSLVEKEPIGLCMKKPTALSRVHREKLKVV